MGNSLGIIMFEVHGNTPRNVVRLNGTRVERKSTLQLLAAEPALSQKKIAQCKRSVDLCIGRLPKRIGFESPDIGESASGMKKRFFRYLAGDQILPGCGVSDDACACHHEREPKHHQISVVEICPVREGPALVICPKAGLLISVLGPPKLTMFSTLKNSALKLSRRRS